MGDAEGRRQLGGRALDDHGAVEFTIPIATSLGAGVMSSADKARLDALNAGTVEHTHSGYATLTFTTVSTDTCAIAINRVE